MSAWLRGTSLVAEVVIFAVIAAFDHVAAPVSDPVEGWWASTGTALTTAVGLLIGVFGDRGGDAPPAQVFSDRASGVALVGQYSPGPGPR